MSEDHEHNHSHGRPNPQDSLDNWRRSDLPFAAKLRLAARNNLAKLRNRSSCCGHPGEPGC